MPSSPAWLSKEVTQLTFPKAFAQWTGTKYIVLDAPGGIEIGSGLTIDAAWWDSERAAETMEGIRFMDDGPAYHRPVGIATVLGVSGVGFLSLCYLMYWGSGYLYQLAVHNTFAFVWIAGAVVIGTRALIVASREKVGKQ